MISISGISNSRVTNSNYDFTAIQRIFDSRIRSIKEPLFKVSTEGLWGSYLNSFTSSAHMQEHNCRCCKNFIDNYGGLVYITASGNLKSLLWDNPSEYGDFNQIFDRLNSIVTGRPIISTFISDSVNLGHKMTAYWEHFHLNVVNTPYINTDRTLNSGQIMAKSIQDIQTLETALTRYKKPIIEKVVTLLRSGSIPGAHLVIGMAEWYLDLHTRLASVKGRAKSNLKWAAVASAPPGFIGMQSSVLATLIDDVVNGDTLEEVIKKYQTKTNGINYQRPQTNPGAQNVKRAEELIEKLGYSESLKRRYARLSDLRLHWSPIPVKTSQAPSGGVFSDVPTRGRTSEPQVTRLNADPVTMTFNRFSKRILPTAKSIKVKTPFVGNYSALVTAVDSSAPNLLQWSNTVSWYVYNGGSRARNWGLMDKAYTEVTGITLQPNMWNNECPHQGESVFFLLKNARDNNDPGLALFPSLIRSELHEVRKTIEAFSKNKKIERLTSGEAAGLRFSDNSAPLELEVTSEDNVIIRYVINTLD